MPQVRVTVNEPGLYRMTAEQYHADPCPEPSLSASMIRNLLHLSPLHAWHKHPQLNPHWEADRSSDAMDEGTILHFLVLGAGAAPVIVDAPDWRTKAAQELRATARARGRAAVLTWRWRQLRRAAAAIRRECRATLDAPEGIGEGIAEAVLIWREGPVWCRCMVDWMPTGIPAPRPVPLIDFKTTSRAASPEQFARSAADLGYDIQAAWYRRGYEAVMRRTAGPLVFVAAEVDSPWGVSRLALGMEYDELGESKVEAGIEVWRECLNRDDWPGYPRRVGFVDAPRYASMAWESRSSRATQQIKDGGRRAQDRRKLAGMAKVAAQIGGPVL